MKGNANRELAAIRRALGVKLEVVDGGIVDTSERTAPQPWAKPAVTKREFIVLRYRQLRKGSVFLPIEKTGREFFLRDAKGRLVKDRRFSIGSELYVKDEAYRAYSAHNGRDGIFSANDWCIVPKD